MTRHWWMTGMVVLLLNIGCSGIGVTPKATPMAATAVQVGTAQLRGLEKIAFVRNQIYVMDADGRNVRWLTNDSAYHWSPAWSPDGRLIAFDTNRGDDEGIFVMDADGGNVHRLSNNPARDASPAWSSDGHWIAFQSFRDGNWQIYVMGSDGENVRRLTNNRAQDGDPDWSPDGRSIVFTSDRDDNEELYVMEVDGGNVRRLTNNPARDLFPAWSPDGKRIAFSSSRDDPNPKGCFPGCNDEIYIMDANGGNAQRLTHNSASDSFPVWSPDGLWIAFASNRDGGYGIYIMDTNGGNVHRLTNDGISPAWSR